MKKIILTETQMQRILLESELDGNMLSTYRVMVTKMIAQVNSIYNRVLNLGIRDILFDQEETIKRYETQMDSLMSLNDSMRKKIDDFVQTNYDEGGDEQHNARLEDLEGAAYDIHSSLDDKLNSMILIFDALRKLGELNQDEGYGRALNSFDDVSDDQNTIEV